MPWVPLVEWVELVICWVVECGFVDLVNSSREYSGEKTQQYRMKKNHRHLAWQTAGLSTLVVVLVVTFVLQLILVSAISLSKISLRRTVVFTAHRQALLAAEGIMQDTIRVFNWPGWLPPSQVQNFEFGSTKVQRSFRKNPDQTYTVKIDGEASDARRRLQGVFLTEQAQTEDQAVRPLDVMLVLDRSGSMTENFDQLRDAALGLVEAANFLPQDRVGIVTFSHDVEPPYDAIIPLTNNFGTFRQLLQPLWAAGGTNISKGLLLAQREFQQRGREDAQSVIVLFSDGVPSYLTNLSTLEPVFCESDTCYCGPSQQCGAQYLPEGGFSPDGVGNACTQQAIALGAQLNSVMPVYVVYYNNLNSNVSACGNIAYTQLMGQRVMSLIAGDSEHYFETSDPDELKEIFRRIGGQLSQPAVREYQYQEVTP